MFVYDKISDKITFLEPTLFLGLTKPYLFKKGDSMVLPTELELSLFQYIKDSLGGLEDLKLESDEFYDSY